MGFNSGFKGLMYTVVCICIDYLARYMVLCLNISFSLKIGEVSHAWLCCVMALNRCGDHTVDSFFFLKMNTMKIFFF